MLADSRWDKLLFQSRESNIYTKIPNIIFQTPNKVYRRGIFEK